MPRCQKYVTVKMCKRTDDHVCIDLKQLKLFYTAEGLLEDTPTPENNIFKFLQSETYIFHMDHPFHP